MGMEFMTAKCADFSGFPMDAIVGALNESSLKLDDLINDMEVEIENWADDNDFPVENEDEQYAAARLYLIEQFKTLFGADEPGYRRDVILENGWCITGGDSWGDDPSEMWDPVISVSYVENQVLELLGYSHPNPEAQAMDIVFRLANVPDDENTLDQLLSLMSEAQQLINR